jgi:hypothetical protein
MYLGSIEQAGDLPKSVRQSGEEDSPQKTQKDKKHKGEEADGWPKAEERFRKCAN